VALVLLCNVAPLQARCKRLNKHLFTIKQDGAVPSCFEALILFMDSLAAASVTSNIR
jgi:hypothetical protein